MARRRSKKRGPVSSTKVKYDGINFASKLEKYMYQCLKKAKIKAEYEGATFELLPSFHFPNKSVEKQRNGKGGFRDRGKTKIRAITYTPDFIGDDFIIEVKGRANPTFPIRWKLFKFYISKYRPDIAIYKPSNQEECNIVVHNILMDRSEKK